MQQNDFRLRVTDVPDDACRTGILGPLVAYNEAKTGRSDHRPLIIAIEDSDARVAGGLWGKTAYLDTFEFQARAFYERVGHQCFAELADYPVGSARYFMKKVLRSR